MENFGFGIWGAALNGKMGMPSVEIKGGPDVLVPMVIGAMEQYPAIQSMLISAVVQHCEKISPEVLPTAIRLLHTMKKENK